MFFRFLNSLFCVALSGAVLCACERSVTIRGDRDDANGWPIPGVVDIHGKALPGVAVTVTGQDGQAVTDVRGQYRMRTEPGLIDLHLMKSGYTSGHLKIDAPSRGSVDATQAVLWPLPSSWGVFLFEEGRYRDLTRIEPRRFKKSDGSPVFGTKIRPGCRTANASPLIISHRMPSYDLRLYRLEQMEAELTHEDGTEYTDKIWSPADSEVVYPAPIDEPERHLVELRLQRPLEPGTYAVHWGAMDGYNTTSKFVFLLEVFDPAAEEEAGAEGEAAAEEGEAIELGDEEPEEPNPTGDGDF